MGWTKLLRALAVLSLIAGTAACSDSGNLGMTNDPDTGTGGGGMDASAPADSGGGGMDATSPAPDSGVAVEDTGTIVTDASPADSGTPPADSGMPPADSGMPPADSGVPPADAGTSGAHIQTVFLILMENHNWDDISGNTTDAPYINTMLTMGAHAENYKGNAHPSEPNYIWLEAGDRLSVRNDNDPSSNHQSTTEHLAAQLNAAGVSWRSYQEDITGTECPLTSVAHYKPKHNPFVFFDDLTGTNDPMNADCIAHNRPLTELEADLTANTVPRYNFITPNMCNDMHDSCAPQNNNVRQGDDWLALWIPRIMASAAYQNNGAILVTWDEGEIAFSCPLANCPIGMIVLSPLAKPAGYSNMTAYNHSSTLRSMQEIFGVGPFLRAAGQATSLSDLFTVFP